LQTLTLSNGKTVRYFADSWGIPLTFNRWPSNVAERNPGGAQPGNNDPSDPEGLLNDPAWAGTPAATQFTQTFGYPVAAGTSFNLTPLLASGGPDKQFGTTDDMYPR